MRCISSVHRYLLPSTSTPTQASLPLPVAPTARAITLVIALINSNSNHTKKHFIKYLPNNHLLREGKKDLIYGINVSWSLSLHSSSFILTSTLLYPFGLHPSYSRGIFIHEPSAHTVPSTGSAFPGCSLHKSCWSPLRTSWAASPISPASLFFSRPNELLLYTDIA